MFNDERYWNIKLLNKWFAISSVLFLLSFIWMFIESRRLSMRHFWIIILATFSIAIAFSAPLFLFLRERRLLEINEMK